MAVKVYGHRTGRNTRKFSFITGDDIQAVTVWPPAGEPGSQPLEDGSEARELAANKLTIVGLYEFHQETWAKLAALNT